MKEGEWEIKEQGEKRHEKGEYDGRGDEGSCSQMMEGWDESVPKKCGQEIRYGTETRSHYDILLKKCGKEMRKKILKNMSKSKKWKL